MKNSNSIIYQRQKPLMESYRENPELALLIDVATIEGKDLTDPFHTTVLVNEHLRQPFKIGVHEALGGLHDFANPGDVLCAALAACFESTMRLVANRLGIVLEKLNVTVNGHVDIRGTLMIDNSVPVGFQKFEINVELETGASTSEKMENLLLHATENCCVVVQTVRKGTPVEVNINS